ncbi:hypothetical protein [Sphingomonas guangdongensis]|uniref:hypothetical protein n=1 Tax=Sphingomonas guangdongensis TaxID=1141890 RepID=UPI000BE39456|nr:hypothetical protein [Sphingomonas guangdongensis]
MIESASRRAQIAATPTARSPLSAPPAGDEEAAAADIVVTASKRGVPLDLYAGGAQVIEGDRLSLAEGARGTNLIELRVARQMRDPGLRSPLPGVHNRVEERTRYGEYALVPRSLQLGFDLAF